MTRLETRTTITQSDRLLPPEGDGWSLRDWQAHLIPGPHGQVGLVSVALWQREVPCPEPIQ